MELDVKNNLTPLTVKEVDEIINQLTYVSPSGQTYSSKQPVNSRLIDIANKIEDAILQVEELFQYVHKTQKVPLLDIRNTIIPTIKQAAEVPQLFHLFYELQTADDYTYRHNIGVGIIATLIGKWLNLKDEELESLTLAATLHDIGKTKIPLSILNKPGKLTSEEYELVKKHTLYGYNLLKSTEGIDKEICLVALQHHERENGAGYPFGLSGTNISFFSKIVAVADVFHAMSSKRVYHDATPFYEVIKQMNDDVYGRLDPKILIPFLHKIMESLVGHKVALTDGRSGLIVMLNQFNVLKPLVKIDNEIIDLAVEKNTELAKIISL